MTLYIMLYDDNVKGLTYLGIAKSENEAYKILSQEYPNLVVSDRYLLESEKVNGYAIVTDEYLDMDIEELDFGVYVTKFKCGKDPTLYLGVSKTYDEAEDLIHAYFMNVHKLKQGEYTSKDFLGNTVICYIETVFV